MWAYENTFYQIYPLGFCGAPTENDGVLANRIKKVSDWVPHLEKLGIGGVYFSPVFESDNHGYDTRNYSKIDCRLGSNEDFAAVCKDLHDAGIKVVLDGVFNHVGRGFWAFQDVLKNRESSAYRDWFNINFSGNDGYNDGLWYEGWEGHYELVKLNLNNGNVVDHLLWCVGKWIDEFDIDGIRLDVAYMLNEDFMRKLRTYCDSRKADFFLLGEMIHGDYNRIMNDSMLHSVTNYECYKGLYSAFNSMNMFEICHSLARQFGPENWTLYKGKHLMNFCDNHDVTRIHTILSHKEQLKALYGTLFAMPGMPCIYYGSEWGADGDKMRGDNDLRPCFPKPEWNELTDFLAACIRIKKESKALNYGSYRNAVLQNKFMIIERAVEGERVMVAINASDETQTAHFDAGCGMALEMISGENHDFGGGSELKPYSVEFWKMEK